MSGLLILGAGGHGLVVGDIASSLGWNPIAFLDDQYPSKMMCGPWPVLGRASPDALPDSCEGMQLVVGIGGCVLRLELGEALRSRGHQLVSLVHPSASVSTRARMGQGCVVVAQAAVNIGAEIGFASVINTGATVGHDVRIGMGAHVAPGANLGGGSTVGDRAWVGIGAVVLQGISIGRDALIGAGAVVTRDVPDGATVVGNPARPLRRSPK